MYQPITYSLLVEKKACKEQLTLFTLHFGKVNAIPLTKEVAARYGSVFDIGWAADNLLHFCDLIEFEKAIAPPLAEYEKAIAPAWENYKKSNYKDNALLTEYYKVHDPIAVVFEKARALAFIEIYKQGMKAS